MPFASLVCRAEFCAAFRLYREDRDDAWNQATFGPCASPNFHGHNWLLEVEIQGPVDQETGMVMDLMALERIVQEVAVQPLDHKNLNLEVDFLAGILPTTENLAAALWPRLASALPDPAELREIRLRESRNHQVVFRGDPSS